MAPDDHQDDRTESFVALTKGTEISQYKIIGKIGAGGMGEVYLALDAKLNRKVALKFLPPHLCQDADSRMRFTREAQAAAKLDHPNIIPVYEVNEFRGRPFFVMAAIEGQSLREHVSGKKLPLGRIIEIGIQICDGLNAAHEKGIIHRDIKPANILVDVQGRVRIADFGLARVSGVDQLTKSGSTLGTVGYMSPEQVSAAAVDQRSDLFSLGVVLYELVTSKHPFRRETDAATLHAITDEELRPVSSLRTDISAGLDKAISRALEKDPAKRFRSAKEMLVYLEEAARELSGAEARPVDLRAIRRTLKKPRIMIPVSVIAAALIAVLFLVYQHRANVRDARDSLPEIEKLAQQRNYARAFHLAARAGEYLPDDPKLDSLMPVVTDKLTAVTYPDQARVFIKPIMTAGEETQQYRFVGVTPISDLLIPRVDHLVLFEKEGYAPRVSLATSRLMRMEGWAFGSVGNSIEMEVQLTEQQTAPESMVFVPGGKYTLVGWGTFSAAEVELEGFFMDEFEVDNESFKAFVDSGGYLEPRYWKFPFIKEGDTVSREEALESFRDATGLPGPRKWVGQTFPEGQADYPVTGITWYEAAAYAEFAGKSLPSVFQWEKAARDGRFTHTIGVVMPWGYIDPDETVKFRANFEGSGLCPVDTFESGISPYGCYNMAGNAKEWCLNRTDAGFVVTGGCWEDPAYMFAYYGSHSGFHSSPSLGFRCVHNTSDDEADRGAMVLDQEIAVLSHDPVGRETFESFLSHYQYDKVPLDPEVIEVNEEPHWTREKVDFAGVNGDRIVAYVYLPRRAAKPYQCISFIPGGNVFWASPVPWNAEWLLGSHIRAGRAVLAVVPKGAVERRWASDYTPPQAHTVRYRDRQVLHATEFSLGLDYLSARGDIDMTRIAYFGISDGAIDGPVYISVDKRYRSAVLVGGGFTEYDLRKLPEANPMNFSPYIECPVMLLNGKYDEAIPYEVSGRVLYDLLPEPKELALLEGGHCPPPKVRVPVVEEWLDETLGEVERE